MRVARARWTNDTVQALLKLVRQLLSKEQRRFLKFCLVGTSGVPVNLFFTWLGYRFLFQSLGAETRTAAASLCGILISIFTNFLLNDLWTWGDREKAQGRGPILARLGRFYLVCSIASAIQFGTAMGLGVWLQLHYLVAQLCGIGLAMAVNFVINNAWTFRDRPPPSS
jgi:dolichol-phosphate mannosyltransferase